MTLQWYSPLDSFQWPTFFLSFSLQGSIPVSDGSRNGPYTVVTTTYWWGDDSLGQKRRMLDKFTSSVQNVFGKYRCRQGNIVKQFSLWPSSCLFAENFVYCQKNSIKFESEVLFFFFKYFTTVCISPTCILLVYWPMLSLIWLIHNQKIKLNVSVKHAANKLCSLQKSNGNCEYSFCSNSN